MKRHLFVAAEQGETEKVLTLLGRGVDVNNGIVT